MSLKFNILEVEVNGIVVRVLSISRSLPSSIGVFFYHDLYGNIFDGNSVMIRSARRLANEGLNSYIYVYPGHELSEGKIEDLDWSRLHNLMLKVSHSIVKERNIERVGMVGYGFGSVLACFISRRLPCEVRCLTLVNPIGKGWIQKMEYEIFKHGDVVSVREAYVVPRKILETYINVDFMKIYSEVDIPTAIIHAVDNEVVPAEEAKNIYDSLRSKRKILVLTSKGGYSLRDFEIREKVASLIAEWVKRHVK